MLWKLLHRHGKTFNAARSIKLNTLITNHGGLRKWEKTDIVPREGDLYGERLYCIRWLKPARRTKEGKKMGRGAFIYREPSSSDLEIEDQIRKRVQSKLSDWQKEGWIPDWRIQDGNETSRLSRERGWAYWHHLFTPRQLLMIGEYSRRIATVDLSIRPALILNLGQLANYNARLCRWHEGAGGGAGSTEMVYYNQALNTLFNYAARSWPFVHKLVVPQHHLRESEYSRAAKLADARTNKDDADLWITDPPYADAVNYEELSEFFLAWYKPHLQACFPEWYTDSKRDDAVKGDDAPFRVAMAECYTRLAEKMPTMACRCSCSLTRTPMCKKTSRSSCGRLACR